MKKGVRMLCGRSCKADRPGPKGLRRPLTTLHLHIPGKPKDHVKCTGCGHKTLVPMRGERAPKHHHHEFSWGQLDG